MSATDARTVQRRQIPLALLMVGLTALTLWSLGQTIVETPEAGVERRARPLERPIGSFAASLVRG